MFPVGCSVNSYIHGEWWWKHRPVIRARRGSRKTITGPILLVTLPGQTLRLKEVHNVLDVDGDGSVCSDAVCGPGGHSDIIGLTGMTICEPIIEDNAAIRKRLQVGIGVGLATLIPVMVSMIYACAS